MQGDKDVGDIGREKKDVPGFLGLQEGFSPIYIGSYRMSCTKTEKKRQRYLPESRKSGLGFTIENDKKTFLNGKNLCLSLQGVSSRDERFFLNPA